MKNYIKKIRNNTYAIQILTLMSGTLIGQIILLVSIPFLTRLYTPSEFGVYSLFYSVVNILGLVSSLKYDQAIMLPKSEKDAQTLVFLSIFITSGTTLITILIILFSYDFIIAYFNGLPDVVWMIPLGVFLLGLIQIFRAFSSRHQYYKEQATIRVVNSLTLVGIQISSRYLFKLNGLIFGRLFADFISVMMFIRYHIVRKTLQWNTLSRRRLLANAKRHEHFPKYQSITVFLNSISQNIPVLLFASLYSPEIAGFYALTVRVLQAPVELIGSSTKAVYYQKAAKKHANGENIFHLYFKTTVGLLKLFIIPLFIVMIFGQYLFDFIFGERWIASGQIAQILIIWFFFLFINSPSVMTFSILKLQKTQMKIEIASLFLRFSSIYIGFYLFHNYLASVVLFAISSVSVNVFVILLIYNKLKNERQV